MMFPDEPYRPGCLDDDVEIAAWASRESKSAETEADLRYFSRAGDANPVGPLWLVSAGPS